MIFVFKKISLAGQMFKCLFVKEFPHYIHVLRLSMLRLGSFFTWLFTLNELKLGIISLAGQTF